MNRSQEEEIKRAKEGYENSLSLTFERIKKTPL